MLISAVVPARDAAATLGRCLDALARSRLPAGVELECVVVDDGSTDSTPRIAASSVATVIRLDRSAGPAAARNRGAAAARGDVLLFVDADVAVHPDTVARVASHFRSGSGSGGAVPDAVFGSYDADPADPGFVSRYRNLFHHWVHQTSPGSARTFWAGCGAVSRRVFLDAGGFNEGYRLPSVEDIELGYRLSAAGHTIVLDPDLQAKHLKRWTLWQIVRTDVARRGVPWLRILLHERGWRDGRVGDAGLNLRASHRVSLVGVWLFMGLAGTGLALGTDGPGAIALLLAMALCLVVVAAANASLHLYLAAGEGPGFALGSIPLTWLYYVDSGVALIWVLLTFWRPPPRPPPGVARHHPG